MSSARAEGTLKRSRSQTGDEEEVDWRPWKALLHDEQTRNKSGRRGLFGLVHIWRTLRFLPRMQGVNPSHDFDSLPTPPAPNYKLPAGWVAHPRRKPGFRTIEDVNYIVVEGELLPPPPKSRQAACFFVHDTTYNPPEAAAVRSRDGVGPLWNAPVAPVPADFKVGAYSSVGLGNLAAKIDEMAEFRTIMGAAPFVRSCKIYAPRYRQANVLAFMPKLPHVFENRESAHKALRLAYDDVKRAFEHFLVEIGTDTPFFLAGHSQGSCHLSRLLVEVVGKSPALTARMVAAYIPGFAVPKAIIEAAPELKLSMSHTDTGVVVSWLTASTEHNCALHKSGVMVTKDKVTPLVDAALIGTSPITWSSQPGKAADDASGGKYLGAALPATNIDVASVVPTTITNLRFSGLQDSYPGRLGIRVKSLKRVDALGYGALPTTLDPPFIRTPPLECEPLCRAERDALLYHDLDFSLFHFNIRRNVHDRLQNWARG